MRWPRLRAWLSQPQAIAIMKLTGRIQVIAQMASADHEADGGLHPPGPPLSSSSVGAERNPPKISSA